MSYLDDPMVFYAVERTLLAWIRTEIAILAFAFLLKRFGFDLEEVEHLEGWLNAALGFLCILVVVISVLSLLQCYLEPVPYGYVTDT